MKKILIATAALSAIASAASAQTVPALDTSAPGAAAAAPAVAAAPAQPEYPRYAPPMLPTVMGANPRLTERERAGVAIANAWEGGTSRPATGTEGAAIFGFGETLPSIVCAPLYVCDLMLQPGETVNDINLGDAVRWRVSPARSGSGPDAVTHVLIKPTDAGLDTNLVVTTDRRTYVLKLVSHRTEWMPRVAFSYPDEQRREWENFIANQRAEQAVAAARELDVQRATILPASDGMSVANLDFGFRISGDNPAWRPLRVYSDGQKTYIQFPPSMTNGAAPALVGIGAGNSTEIINYRVDGDRYIVDQVLDRGALISGVGRRQVKVEIQRAGEG